MRKILTVIAFLSIGFGINEFIHLYISSLPQSTTRKAEISKESTSSSVVIETTSHIDTVQRVIDGDTIELTSGERVRYIGIDTPETVDPRKTVQCFGREAKEENVRLVDGKTIRLEKDTSEIDRYGRLLRYVYVGDVMVNDALVRNGFAYSSSFPPDIKYQDRFLLAQQEARENNRGLWSGCEFSNTTPEVRLPQSGGLQPRNPEERDFGAGQSTATCVIKGNISSKGEKIYHNPGCGSYDKTAIDESAGERWFCSEDEAVGAGWRKAKNC